jgi:N-acetylglucosamine-6-sulfatase
MRRAAVLLLLMSGALAACTSNSPTTGAADGSAKTNVVFVLTDDLAVNLVQYMPHVQALAKGEQRSATTR